MSEPTDAEIEAELEQWAAEHPSDDAVPNCTFCGKPCVWVSNATPGGAVLNTTFYWACPDHPGLMFLPGK